MKRLTWLADAGLGWAAGICAILLVAFVIFPAVIGTVEFTGSPVEWFLLAQTLVIVSPFALLGGYIGGRFAVEGGRSTQITMAIIGGIIAAIPVSCLSLWYGGW